MMPFTGAAQSAGGFLSRIKAFRRARSGVAALEFALILPVMLTLYIGGVEVTDGLIAKRKVSHAASAIADLVAQDTQIADSAEMADIFAAGSAIMAPFSATSLKVAVIGIAVDADKKATVSWSQVLNGATCAKKGTSVTVPVGLATAGSFLVLVKAEYPYTPELGYVLSGTIDLKEGFYQQSRSGKAITGPSCG